ncbi:zinc-ribbon domain-containing protein [Pseudarthrobacter sp. NBSH8]|uniref:zinc-ribbon domain-containing protein n=1 Tax=Pseudarthrobacter sp. NBSH8 TaxID=2596911 RepID=UPI0016278F9A|nr:zinc-ribbon domain-containing protein [Pseudarthrobacter sp. NBSH8]
MRIHALLSTGRASKTLLDEVVCRIDSARSNEHLGVPHPSDLPAIADVLDAVTDPDIQTATLDETVTFAIRYSKMSAILETRVTGCTPELCDEVWLLLRPSAVWVRTTLLGEAPVDRFEPFIIPAPAVNPSEPGYPLEPFDRSMDCLRTVGQDSEKWWEDRYMIRQPSSPHKEFLLICDNGHIQRTAKGHARRAGTEDFHCAVCSGQRVIAGLNSLGDLMPKFVPEWDQSANGVLTPFMVSPGSNRKVGWIDERGHHYEAYIINRTQRGTGCPACAAKAVLPGFNDLETSHPELAALWDHDANPDLKPTDVSAGNSKTRVHFRCVMGHPFVRTPAKLIESGGRCQTCNGRILILGVNDLATARPEIAAWWHPTKNGNLSPTMVKPGSEIEVWWICPDGHEFPANVDYRCRQEKATCPVDTGRLLLTGVNDLATKEPALVLDWDGPRNGMPPSQTVPTNHVWNWTCRFGHTQRATVANRRRAGGCTDCPPEDRVAQSKQKFARGRQGWDKRKAKLVVPGELYCGQARPQAPTYLSSR